MAGQNNPASSKHLAELQALLDKKLAEKIARRKQLQIEQEERDRVYKEQLAKSTPFGGANRGSRAGLQRFD